MGAEWELDNNKRKPAGPAVGNTCSAVVGITYNGLRLFCLVLVVPPLCPRFRVQSHATVMDVAGTTAVVHLSKEWASL